MVERDSRLDAIRAVAMLLIVVAHYVQILGSWSIASWLNIGVQLFFILTAWLFCGRTFDTRKEIICFYRKRYVRIMAPIWVYLLMVCGVLFAVHQPPPPTAVVMYLVGLAAFSSYGILGLGHFWYNTAILLCYGIIPLMDRILQKFEYRFLRIGTVATLSLMMIVLFSKCSFLAFGIDVAFFIVLYCVLKRKEIDKFAKRLAQESIVPALLLTLARIMVDAIQPSFITRYVDAYEGIVTVSKCMLAVFLFAFFYNALDGKHIPAIFSKIAQVSYEVYIAHQFILLVVNRLLEGFSMPRVVHCTALLVLSIPIITANVVVLRRLECLIEKKAGR